MKHPTTDTPNKTYKLDKYLANNTKKPADFDKQNIQTP
jgi:hypothetical protein